MSDRWEFSDEKGNFRLESPQCSSHLYFPLANDKGMMSSITPTLGGDAKAGQNTFFLPPVSADDLHNQRSGRNFWVYIGGAGAWSAAGASARQQADRFEGCEEKSTLEAGFLWHRLRQENAGLGIRAEVTSFVPAEGGPVELMRVTLTNTSAQPLAITPTAAIPVYGRSADNVRDHRHVTGLLHRIRTVEAGVEVRPAMTFDERGHRPNAVCYRVYGADGEGNPPVGSFPCLEEFIGEGGNLEWPEAVVRNEREPAPPGTSVDGYEAVGALRFHDCALAPGQSAEYFLCLAVTEGEGREARLREFLSPSGFQKHLDATEAFWEGKLNGLRFESACGHFDLWMKWVTLQPVLRRIYGCSFLPHHDYGRGGRGWRDLWQDSLALLLLEPEATRSQLYSHFAGVRLDGTNATIIGASPGEFIADRNNISRVWSDHAAWPFFTTNLYVDTTGDIDFLFERQTYFKDARVMRSTQTDAAWTPEYGNRQKTITGDVYEGTILEHLLLQNLAAFYHVGEHNNVRLENADWNDALDMAPDRGETVAFSAFYAGNLMELAGLLREVAGRRGVREIEVACEMRTLFDTLHDPVDYDSPEAKRALLGEYTRSCVRGFTGGKVPLDILCAAGDLEKKAKWMAAHIAGDERVRSSEGYEWFNGYYDNAGLRVEGENALGVRMTLTGQVFPLMMGVATGEQAQRTAEACRRYLYDEALQGYRLNTDFHEVKLDLGRCFGFAFGHKENGAVFSHMAVMYAFALYRRGLAAEGYEVLRSLYRLSADFERARIYPGIPEYFNPKGRGMYSWLTGSASWLLLTLQAQAYGVRGRLGDLVLEPKLMRGQFDGAGLAAVRTAFAGRRLKITYRNEQRLDWGEYGIAGVAVDGAPVEHRMNGGAAEIGRAVIERLDAGVVHEVEVLLKRK